MDLNGWISGGDTVDAGLNLKKKELLENAIDFCTFFFLQRSFAKENKINTGFEEIARASIDGKDLKIDSSLPLENCFFSNPAYLEEYYELEEAPNNNNFAIKVLQEMTELDFDIDLRGASPEDSWNRFRMVISYLRVLYQIFAIVIPQRQYKVDIKKLQCIEFSMSKLLFAAGQLGAVGVEQIIHYDEKLKWSNGKTAAAEIRKAMAIALYKDLSDDFISNNSGDAIANQIRKKWKTKYGESKKIPKAKAIRGYIGLKKGTKPLKTQI